jgi:hypothetical protein
MSQDPDRQRTKDPIRAYFYFNLNNDKVPAKNIQTSDHRASFYRVETELSSPELILSILLAVSGCFPFAASTEASATGDASHSPQLRHTRYKRLLVVSHRNNLHAPA